MPGVRIYPFKEVESGALVDRNLIWESRLSSRLIGLDGVSGRIDVDLTPETALRLGSRSGPRSTAATGWSRAEPPPPRAG